MSGQYILKGRETVPETDILKWGESMKGERRVGYDEVGDKRVSTVFLGLDHQYGDGPPLLFETMVFPENSSSDLYCERYSTYDEAETGHVKVVQGLKDGTLELYGVGNE